MPTQTLHKTRIIIFAVLWIAAQCLMILPVIIMPGGEGGGRVSLVIPVALVGAPLGPLAGGIARPGESSCMKFSLTLLPYLLPFLALVAASLMITPASPRRWRIASLIAWAIGCAGWMFGGFMSLGFALG